MKKFDDMHEKIRGARKNRQRRFSRFLPISLFSACLLLCGCKEEPSAPAATTPEPTGGGLVSVERLRARRARFLTVDGRKKEAEVLFSVEYPSSFGICPEEHRELTAFIDGMLDGAADFDTAVEEMSEKIFESIANVEEDEGQDENRNLSCTVSGEMTYVDSRYFSYKVSLRGSAFDTKLGTFDRKKGRPLVTADIVAPGDFPVLRRHMRDYIKMAIPFLDENTFGSMPRDWPVVKDAFGIDRTGITWDYFGDGLQLGVNMEVVVTWKKLDDILIDPEAVPDGKFGRAAEGAGNGSPWWRFPYEKYSYTATTPPDPPFSGTNHPYASLGYKMEIPVRGNMPQDRFDALQSCLGAVVCGGVKPHSTVKEAAMTRTESYWKKLIAECADAPEDRSGILELEFEIKYRGPEYVSCCFLEQDGPPSGTVCTNLVWSWNAMRPLRVEEVVDMRKRPQLAKMMRDCVREDLGDDETVLPDYARDWPDDLTNFRLEGDGVVFCCHAGDVVIGGHGPYETFLTWEQVRPVLRADFAIPER